MNSNYPSGTWEADPLAPWNQPEEEPENERAEIIVTIERELYTVDEWREMLEAEILVRCIDCRFSSFGKKGLQCDVREAAGSFKVPEDGFCYLGIKEE